MNNTSILRKDIWIINFLKGIFIVFVILIHSNTYLELGWDNKIWYSFFVQLAVSFFMILSGYTFSIRPTKKQLSLKAMYKKNDLFKQLVRLLIPMLITGCIYVFYAIVSNKDQIIKDLLIVQYGAGSYYFLLMIELVLIFPILYYFVNKLGGYFVLVSIFINIAYDLVAIVLDFEEYLYSRIIIRFIAFVVTGCWLYLSKPKINKIVFFSAIIGVIYIYISEYIEGYHEYIFVYSKEYACPVLGWCTLIIIIILALFKEWQPSNKYIFYITSIVGKSSYHILCVQMIWYNIMSFCIKHIIIIESPIMWALISCIICLLGGIIFYYIEQKTTNKIILMISSKKEKQQ